MLSRHAIERCQQRGITKGMLEALLDEADVDMPAGNNCRLQMISRRKARTVRLDPRIHDLRVVISDDSQKIVTVYRAKGPLNLQR